MTPKEWEALRLNRIEKYTKEIESIFNKAAAEAASIGQLFNATDLFSKPFSFSDYPITKDRIDKLMKSMSQNIEATVVNGVTAEWKNSNYRNDEIAQRILGLEPDEELHTGKFKKYFNNNDKALQAFIQRKDYGLNLSDRVWKYTEKFKSEIELGLDTGIRAGLPASEMARDLKQYLQYPDKLFRRVRDQHGNLQLSKPASEFHPGQGVYRSSYKNAMRLTRTETNMAYHAADHARFQDWDFIVGIEVRLTNNPGHITDICDDLKGRYPKTFKFVGWHPHCMCHTVTILKTQAEIDADVERIMNGEPTDGASRNAVKEMPGNFKDWAKQNQERIATAKNMPYFIKDNFTGTDTSKWFIKPVEPAKVVAKPTPARITPSEIAKQRIASRTPEQRTAIQDAWNERRIINRRKQIAELAEKRHAARTKLDAFKTQTKWDERVRKQIDINTPVEKIAISKYNLENFRSAYKNRLDQKISPDQAWDMIAEANRNRLRITPEFIAKAKAAGVDAAEIDRLIRIAKMPTSTADSFNWRISEMEHAIEKHEKKAASVQKQKITPAAKAATQKSQVDIPVELRDGGIYFNATNIKINEEIFKLLDEKRPVQLVIHKTDGSQFSPSIMQVRLQNGTRQAKSAWEHESVIYHEYGHAIDHQRGLRWNNDTRDIMSKWKVKMAEKVEYTKSVKLWDYDTQKYVTITKTVKAPLAAQITDRIRNILLKCQRMDEKLFLAKGVTKADMIEQLSSLADTIKSLNIRYGGGHTTEYFKTPGFSQAEFIAHAFENKFIGNYMFKKLAPELYQDMIDYINILKP